MNVMINWALKLAEIVYDWHSARACRRKNEHRKMPHVRKDSTGERHHFGLRAFDRGDGRALDAIVSVKTQEPDKIVVKTFRRAEALVRASLNKWGD